MELRQTQRQTQMLTPQMAQSIKILQMDIQELRENVEEVFQENPMLELPEPKETPDSLEELSRRVGSLAAGDWQNAYYHAQDAEEGRGDPLSSVGCFLDEDNDLKRYILSQFMVTELESDVMEGVEFLLDRLERYTQRIAEYVEAMGGVQRLEQLPVRPAPIDSAVLAAELAETARLLAPRLTASLSAPAPGPVALDHGILLTVAENLIGNAARFGRERLEIALSREGDTLTLTVADDGPGFPPELLRDGPKPFGRLAESAAEEEETIYVPALVDILWNGEENRQERKLIRFSVASYAEKYLEEENRGIVFLQNQNIVAVVKGLKRLEAKEFLCELAAAVKENCGCCIGAVAGEEVYSMSQIPASYQKCLEWRGYLFFEDQLGVPVVLTRSRVFQKQPFHQDFHPLRRCLLDLHQVPVQFPRQHHALIPSLPVLFQVCPAQHPVLPDCRLWFLYGQVREQVIPFAVVSQFHAHFLLLCFCFHALKR